MAYSRHSSYGSPSKDRIAARYRQALVLVGVIIIGMIISSAVNAIPGGKRTSAHKAVQIETPVN